jgi:hypothetical protein
MLITLLHDQKYMAEHRPRDVAISTFPGCSYSNFGALRITPSFM